MGYPILILCYQRVTELEKVVASVQQLCPSKIYFHLHVAPDPMGQEKVDEVKSFIGSYMGGEYEFKYSEEPLGVRKSLYSALDWVSALESKFYVFEDDVVLNDESALEANDLMDAIGNGAGIVKLGVNPLTGIYWGWGLNRNAWAMIKAVDLSLIPYEQSKHVFDNEIQYKGLVEMYRRNWNMAWDDEFHAIVNILKLPVLYSKKPLTEHIGKVSTRVGNGLDKGFGEGKHIMYKNGKLVN